MVLKLNKNTKCPQNADVWLLMVGNNSKSSNNIHKWIHHNLYAQPVSCI